MKDHTVLLKETEAFFVVKEVSMGVRTFACVVIRLKSV